MEGGREGVSFSRREREIARLIDGRFALSLRSFSFVNGNWEAKQPNRRTSAADKSHLGKKKSLTQGGREMSNSCLRSEGDGFHPICDHFSISVGEQEVLRQEYFNRISHKIGYKVASTSSLKLNLGHLLHNPLIT